jgi:hypothetical protein
MRHILMLGLVTSCVALAGDGGGRRFQAEVWAGAPTFFATGAHQRLTSKDPACVTVKGGRPWPTLVGGPAGCHTQVEVSDGKSSVVYELTVVAAPRDRASDRLVVHAGDVVPFPLRKGTESSSNEKIAYVFIMPHPEDPPTLIQAGAPGQATIRFTSLQGEKRQLEVVVLPELKR